MNIDLKDLRLYIFSGHTCGVFEKDLYEKAYKSWKEVWQQTFLELKGVSQIYSDGFSKQDKIVAIFYKDTCISFAGLRGYDFSISASKEDSIFASWDNQSFERLTRDGSKILVCSNLGVHKDYRGRIGEDTSLKLLNIYLSVKVLLDEDYNAMAGTTRFNKGVNTAAFSNGATFLNRAEMHGVDVDLVCFYKKEILANLADLQQSLGEELWDLRVDYTKPETTKRKLLRVA